MDIILHYFKEVWQIFIDMSPYLLLGFLIAGVLHVFLPKTIFKKHLGQSNMSSIIKAALFGIPLPLCSCGVIPTGISIYKNGASKGATNSFLISTPQTGVDSVLITYSLMNIYWAISRPIIALIAGVFGGWLTEKTDPEPQELIIDEVDTSSHEILNFKDKVVSMFNYSFINFLGDISRQLILGVLLAALITSFVPTSLFEQTLNSPIINMLIILVASIPLYVCATGSVPIATSLLIVGVSPGAVLVFLMAGPATNMATITVLWRSLGKKMTLAYLSAIIISALGFGIVIDYLIDSSYFLITTSAQAHIHGENNWIGIISSILLIGLILHIEFKKIFPPKVKINQMEKTYYIEGMTCNHCKNSVETNIAKLSAVDYAKVDLANKQLIIEGSVTDKEIEDKINDLGYEYKGISS